VIGRIIAGEVILQRHIEEAVDALMKTRFGFLNSISKGYRERNIPEEYPRSPVVETILYFMQHGSS
jgi:hypothetical protein